MDAPGPSFLPQRPALDPAGLRGSDLADLEGFRRKRAQMQKWRHFNFNFKVGNIHSSSFSRTRGGFCGAGAAVSWVLNDIITFIFV